MSREFVVMSVALMFGLWAGMATQDDRVNVAHAQRDLAINRLNETIEALKIQRMLRSVEETLRETDALLRTVDEPFEPVIDEEAIRRRLENMSREEVLEEIDRVLQGEKEEEKLQEEKPPHLKPKPRFVIPRGAKVALL